MSAPIIAEVSDLEVRFRVRRGRRRVVARAVDGVDLGIRAGEVLALVGESGCGKTTIARAMMRLEDATGGRISIDGHDVTRLRGRALRRLRRSFQMVFQDPFESLPPNATAIGVVEEGLRIHRRDLDAAARRALALSALRSSGLVPEEQIAERPVFRLSGGQRQRVAIAAALVLEPKLILADEPVSMLDVSLRAGVVRLLLDLRTRLGAAILFITHDLALAGAIADRVAVVYLGRVVEEGPAADVIDSPRHPYTRALVGVIPDPRRVGPVPLLTGEAPSATDIAHGCRFAPRCPRYRELGEPVRCRSEDPVLAPEANAHRAACHFPPRTEETP